MVRITLLLLLALPALANDLTVAWISRTPEIDYVWNSSNPRVEGWPAEGAEVVWRAHVRSWRDAASTVDYVWRVDGRAVANGRATLAPNAYTIVELPRPWTFARHRLSFEIVEGPRLEVFTDALSVALYVEQSLYDYFRDHQRDLGIGSTGWEDWAQRLIGFYNDMAAMAVYPETPDGVLDRWRIQKIVIVPDNALPLVPLPDHGARAGEPNGMTHPNSADRSVDLQIGFRAATLSAYNDTHTVSASNAFYLAPVILHELGHARYLTDVYAFDVQHFPPAKVVELPDLASTRFIFFTPEQGLMNGNYTFIDRYSAIALNRIAGRRATVGNYNDPENVGSFLNDLPEQNRLTVRDGGGALLANAKVEIFQSQPFQVDAWYAAHYDATPDLTLQTDENGQVLVGRSPFAPDGKVVNHWRGTNAVAIVRVTKAGGEPQYGFLESRLFNMAYWRGDTAFADHELIVGGPRCRNRGPTLVSPAWDARVEGSSVTLTWARLDGASRYTVYAAPAGRAPHPIGTTTSTQLTATLAGSTYWWVVADFDNGCPPMRSEGSRIDVQARMRRRAVR